MSRIHLGPRRLIAPPLPDVPALKATHTVVRLAAADQARRASAWLCEPGSRRSSSLDLLLPGAWAKSRSSSTPILRGRPAVVRRSPAAAGRSRPGSPDSATISCSLRPGRTSPPESDGRRGGAGPTSRQGDGEHEAVSIIPRCRTPSPSQSPRFAEDSAGSTLPGRRIHRARLILAQRLGKPVLVEGPAGVGRPSSRSAPRSTGRRQSASVPTRGSTRPRRSTSGTIASSCCGSRPRPRRAESASEAPGAPRAATSPRTSSSPGRCSGVSAEDPVVLLIDEINRPGVQCCSRSSRTPDLDPVRCDRGAYPADRGPHLNNSRELRGAEAPRLYLWLDYPSVDGSRDRPPARRISMRGYSAAESKDHP